ncbi:MAG: hypothetical protein ACI9U2_000847 [Bradymonadia bacterium]|jgi:hypothetical protein
MRHLFYKFLLVLSVIGVASPAMAQRSRAEVRLERLLSSARDYYDNLELEEAERALNEAIDLAERDRIAGPVVAEIYIQRGILSFVRDRDREAAVVDFTRALRMNSRAVLDPLVSTPQLKELFDRASKEASRGDRRDSRRDDRRDTRRDDGRDARRPPPPPRDEVAHDSPRVVRGGRPFDLKIRVSGSLNSQVYRVYAFYRGLRDLKKLELLPKGRESFEGQIAGRFVEGRNLSYYIVVEDRSGKRIGGVASPGNPMVVQIKGGTLDGLDEMPSGDGLDGGGSGGGDHEFISVGISLGTGGGFITDLAQPINSKGANIQPGFAAAPVHALIELDFWVSDWFAIGAFGRIQVVEFAHMEGGRLKFKVHESANSRFVLRGGGGFGQVRHLVDLVGVLDTTLEGPYLYTLGASWHYRFTESVALALTPDFIHLIGTSPSLHFDFSAGVRFGF